MPLSQDDRDVLINVQTTVEHMYHRLFGNGNPGEIDTIQEKQDKLEAFDNKLTGALILISIILTLLGSAVVVHITSR